MRTVLDFRLHFLAPVLTEPGFLYRLEHFEEEPNGSFQWQGHERPYHLNLFAKLQVHNVEFEGNYW